MTKNDKIQEFEGCGGDCACAKMSKDDPCVLPSGGVQLDKDGKCPCGKSADDCCHSSDSEGNDALHELCEPHNGKHVCEIASDLQKTGM